ncbi:MAG: HAD-IA family hydrolase [Pseudomonadota bacterium]|nr:HAD-IA family hydrolase [Pseudomonadota bacterium]MEE3100856.1 HAD-IA family hydrolase [Pseudomonadota bacterium]
MTPPRCAIFDLDGTLADTSADLIGAANTALADLGAAGLDPVADAGTSGRGGRAMLRLGLARAGWEPARIAPAVEAAMPPFLAAYEARIAAESRLFPGVHAALDRLEDAGWRLAICTNKPERLARLLLDALGALPRFGALIGADSVEAPKPDPRPVRAAAERAGSTLAVSVMVGDTVTDREAARAAGIPCVLVDFGLSADDLASLNPEALTREYAELPALLETLRPAPVAS